MHFCLLSMVSLWEVGRLILTSSYNSLCSHAVKLIPANLAKVVKLLWKARHKWYSLGLELGIDEITLKAISIDNDCVDTCFTEMLSHLLNNMSGPLLSWKRIMNALCQPSIGCKKVASDIAMSSDTLLPGKFS